MLHQKDMLSKSSCPSGSSNSAVSQANSVVIIILSAWACASSSRCVYVFMGICVVGLDGEVQAGCETCNFALTLFFNCWNRDCGAAGLVGTGVGGLMSQVF